MFAILLGLLEIRAKILPVAGLDWGVNGVVIGSKAKNLPITGLNWGANGVVIGGRAKNLPIADLNWGVNGVVIFTAAVHGLLGIIAWKPSWPTDGVRWAVFAASWLPQPA